MAVTAYEGMFLLDPVQYARDPEKVAGQLPELIQQFGGEVLVSRLWEERRLAYPIKGHRKGVYWLTYFRMEGKNLAPLQQQCRLTDSILRVLFLKLDPRIVDTLVEYAKSGQVVPQRRQPVETPAASAPAEESSEGEKDSGEKSEEAVSTNGEDAQQ